MAPLKRTTDNLQHEQLTMTDFFGEWLQLKHFLSQMVEPFGKRVYKAIDNNTMRSALYLDPRYQVFLSESDKVLAIEHLEQLWYCLDVRDDAIAEISDDPQTTKDVEENSSVLHQLIQKQLNVAQRCQRTRRSPSNTTTQSIKEKLAQFGETDLIPEKENILEFWQEQKRRMPELYQLSLVLFAVPATQVSVERCFSTLKYIYTK